MPEEAKKSTENIETIKVNDKVVENFDFRLGRENPAEKRELQEIPHTPAKTEQPETRDIEKNDIATPSQVTVPPESPLAIKREKSIEAILEKDLEQMYSQMPAEKQAEFKRKGEETARKINALFEKTKVKVRQIIELIKNWLLTIPGINKFFIEQEAKIKADEIIKLKSN